jgi:hypothetical protein
LPTKTKTKNKGAAGAKNIDKAQAAAKAKRAANHERDNEIRPQVVEDLESGKKLSEVAAKFHITPGKAAFLRMQAHVASHPKMKIKGEDAELVAGIKAARDAQDEFSAWGWISARTGLPEVRVKAIAEKAGIAVKGTHVAKARKEARVASAPPEAAKGTGKTETKKKGNPSKAQ